MPSQMAGISGLHSRHTRGDRHSCRVEAKNPALLSSRVDLLELTPKKDVLFIIGDWNAKVGSQEIPRVRGKFGLGVQNEAG